MGNYLFRNTGLTGDLHGERTARITNSEAEERLHLMAVVKHGAVYYPSVLIGEMFQVLVVGGDHAERLLPVEPVE